MMNRSKHAPAAIVFLLMLSSYTGRTWGQAPDSRMAIDSVVSLCQSNIAFPGQSDDSLIAFYRRSGAITKVFTPAKGVSVVCRIRTNKDTVFIKEYYALHQELIYLKEQHFIDSPNHIIDTLHNKDFKLGYEAFYYIIDGWHAGGKMTYSYDFRDYNYAPEPITYTLKSIKEYKAYLPLR